MTQQSTEPHAPCINEERARRLMARAGLDLLLANSAFNVAYLTGFIHHCWGWDGIQQFMDRNVWRDDCRPLAGFCIDPAKKTFIACDAWVMRFNYVYPDVEVFQSMDSYSAPLHENNFRFPPLDWTLTAIKSRGLESARIGYEDTRLPDYYLRILQAKLPRATFIPVDDLFWQIRAVKTPEEIRRLREAFRIATQIYRETFAMMKPGVQLMDITRIQMARAQELGGLWYFNHLWVHTPGQPWDPPADYRLKPGDEGGCDLGIYFQGYGCDFGRTVSLGPVHEQIREEHTSVKEVYDAMREVARIGNTGADVFNAAQKAIQEKRGGRAAGCLGHGLGLECHEVPAVLPTETEPMEENMVLQLEVGSVEPPRGTFVFLEDAGVLTPRGWEPLNELPREVIQAG